MKVRENTQKLLGEFGSVLGLLKSGLQGLQPSAGVAPCCAQPVCGCHAVHAPRGLQGTDTNISVSKFQSEVPWNKLRGSLWRNSSLALSTPPNSNMRVGQWVLGNKNLLFQAAAAFPSLPRSWSVWRAGNYRVRIEETFKN